ncbi:MULTISPECIES: MurR/RpiR family transcriptional regulator [unclassified Sinorhizobium]|uniref:MurR/RpiR family transcriptional regulator n=1 Tax=unclassified Sinorhizobium TaxID=2613772 RepID=UPI0035266878
MNKALKSQPLLLDMIYESINTAPKALARIALYIAQDPEIILTQSVTDVARQTESGQASVVRFCRTLGFSGFPEFKIALSGEIERERASHRAHHADPGDAFLAPEIASLSAALQNAIASSARLLDRAQIGRVIERLRIARRVEIFGMGASSVCADLLTIRLIWLGLPVHSPGSASMSHGLARTLDASSLAIGISNSGVTEETKDFLEIARNAGAQTLAITTRADCPIAQTADEVLLLSSTGSWPEAGSGMHVPSFILLSECLARGLREINNKP